MVYYISSQVFQQTISTTLKEQNHVVLQSIVENHMLLYKYVKNNIAKFGSDIDTFLIDLSALDDSDEDILNAVKTLRTLHDTARIIIFASTRLPGDKLLSDLFSLGILNIIATSDYLGLKQELITCLSEKGKSFKDALTFKDVRENVEVIGKERLKVVSRVLIGVTGSQPRMGVTHNVIILANYLRKLGFLVAAVEKNQSGDFERIRSGHGEKLHGYYFNMHGVDYYPEVLDKEKMRIITDQSYNFIVNDYGGLDSCDKMDFLKCHKKLILTGSKTWELHFLRRILKEYPDDVLKQFSFCFNLIYPEYEKHLKQAMKYPDGKAMEVFFLGYNPEPFNTDKFPAAEEILDDYMLTPAVKKRKGLLSFSGRTGKKNDKKT